MFIDATTLPENNEIEADVCIVGAGAAGITLARDLSDSSLRIALFESGSFEFDQETQDLYDGDVVGQSFTPLEVDRLRYFGGTTNHWAGSCHPFDPIDFEGWPYQQDVLDPYYRRAQDICQLGPYTYDPADWTADDKLPLDLGPGARFQSGVYQVSPPTRFGQVYRPDLETANNVSVYLNANLINIETNESASVVTGLALACLNGRHFRAKARYYVLAAGGIESPRLLLNSNKIQKEGLGNGNDLVGRYFMDHASVRNAGTILFTDPNPKLGFYYLRPVRDDYRVMGYLTPTPELRRAEGLPAFSIGITPEASPYTGLARPSLLTIYRSLMDGHIPDRLMFHLGNVWTGVEQRLRQLYWKANEPESFSTGYIVGCPPDPQSRVTLTDNLDVLGLRRVKLDWRLPGDFERTMRRGLEILGEELGRSGLGRLRINSSATGKDPVNEICNAHHHMGTTRMHTDPKQGVVDEHCRVHGIANLFVAGGSVFPTYSFDNPTMTIVALSLKLSEHLKSRTM